MKIHFASAFPRQSFFPRLVGFYINSLGIYFGNLGKNFDEKLTCKDAPFTSNFTKNKYSVYNYCCINFVAQILFAMPFALFSRQKLRFKKIAFQMLYLSSKDKYERKMLNRLKRSFKIKNNINSFCLMSQAFLRRQMNKC